MPSQKNKALTIKKRKPDPNPKSYKGIKYTPKGLGLKTETKAEIDNYSMSPGARSLGYDKPKTGAEKALRAMDIVGQRQGGMKKRVDPKVQAAFDAVGKKPGYLMKKTIGKITKK